MGVNDVRAAGTGTTAASNYYNKIFELAKGSWKSDNIIYVSVNPVVDGKSNAYNSGVNEFNSTMKTKISNSNLQNLKYCDTNSKLNITLSNAPDGLHYNKSVYQSIYNTIINECT